MYTVRGSFDAKLKENSVTPITILLNANKFGIQKQKVKKEIFH